MSDQNQLEKTERAIDRPTANALTINRTTGGTFSVAPQNMGELLEFAKLMAVSSFCVRPAFRGNPGACLGVALQAFRCGGDPFAWCNKAYITRNKAGEEQISYEAQLVHGVVNTSTVLQRRLRPVYEGEGTARRCRIVGFIKGESEPFEYLSPPISQIAVKNSPLWTADPDQQLFYYSSRAWARRHVPEILLGIYAPEDFTETIDLIPEPEPRREDFIADAREPVDERYPVIDNDGVEHAYGAADNAVEGIGGVLREAYRQGLARLDAAWENNQQTVEQLVGDGFDGATALCETYAAYRKDLASLPPASAAVERPGANTGEVAAPSGVTVGRPAEGDKRATAEAEGRPGNVAPGPLPPSGAQGSPQASEAPPPSTGPANPEPPTGAPAAATVPPPEHLSKGPGDTPAEAAQPPAQTAPANAPANAPERPPANDRQSLLIQPPLKSGKPDYRTWAVALFMPKVRQTKDGARLAYLIGDNEANLAEARKALSADDARELDAVLEAAQRSATYE
jgi:hypothetical protein